MLCSIVTIDMKRPRSVGDTMNNPIRPRRHPCNCRANIPRHRAFACSEAHPDLDLGADPVQDRRPRTQTSGRWEARKLESSSLCPHIFPPTRRQSGHDVAVNVSRLQAASVSLLTTVPHAKLPLAKLLTSHPAELSHHPICTAIFHFEPRVSCGCRRPSIPSLLARHAAVCSHSVQSLSPNCISRHHLSFRRTTAVLIAYHTTRLFSTQL